MVVAVVLTGGLDRRVSAFLRVELTHAPAVSIVYRRYCEVWSWEYPPSFPELFKAVAVGGWSGTFKGSWGREVGFLAVLDVPVVFQRQVPAVQVVHVLEVAPDSVHRQVCSRDAKTVEIPQVHFFEQGCDGPDTAEARGYSTGELG